MKTPESLLRTITAIKGRLYKINQFVVAILMIILILDVWLGVLDRYWLKLQLGWVEELARYIMIWAILMAVPCCTANREHMGLTFIADRLPDRLNLILQVVLSALTASFFAYISYLGITFAEKGASQLSTVFGMPMAYAYAAVPVTFGLAALQALLVFLEDLFAALSAEYQTPSLPQQEDI
ncbi:TRAP-type C4-dicarboxylate transport system, small permease component [Grimontia indica]|uniref:TRAP transporter small permease protein n=1 Tax=Grimontia indica TaxID=1056512 RepID=R1GXR8_9GAMM|nr:TRAP transporter small permease [Grimontia indica]EOD80849.1 TRAP-type C4-dicarboxylate transport system, small permease component [Grimontia indica]